MMSPRSARSARTTSRNLVFVSYSHVDARWLDRLRIHLKPLERQGVLALWDDTKIKPGTRWREEIRTALEHARVAVLLVTADFLASDFITTNELPPLLSAAEKGGTLILPLIVKPCRFLQTPGLNQFQAVNSPSEPLVAFRSARREELYLRLTGLIEEALDPAPVIGGSSGSRRPRETPSHAAEGRTSAVGFGRYTIRELESGSIEVTRDGSEVRPAKPSLREIASELNLGLLNRNGNPLNTRQLGRLVIDRISSPGRE